MLIGKYYISLIEYTLQFKNISVFIFNLISPHNYTYNEFIFFFMFLQ